MALSAQDGRLVRRNDYELLWIEPWGEGLRVRATCLAAMRDDRDWALLPPRKADAAISVNGDDASIASGGLVARIHHRGQISFFDSKGELLLEERWRTRSSGSSFSTRIEGKGAAAVRGEPVPDRRPVEPRDDERIFGMGQYEDGRLDLKGSTLELAHRNSQASVPFFLSNKRYGFLRSLRSSAATIAANVPVNTSTGRFALASPRVECGAWGSPAW